MYIFAIPDPRIKLTISKNLAEFNKHFYPLDYVTAIKLYKDSYRTLKDNALKTLNSLNSSANLKKIYFDI